MEIKILRELIEPALFREKIKLKSIRWKKIENKNVLEITIEKEGGTSLKDCEKASRIIEKILDEKDLIKTRYFLAVFSSGRKWK